MEKELNAINPKLTPMQYSTLCRCVRDDFYYYYDQCNADPDADHSDDLDRMEEDVDLMEALLHSLKSEAAEEQIKIVIADFLSKIAEVA
jgi:hypothetical protein